MNLYPLIKKPTFLTKEQKALALKELDKLFDEFLEIKRSRLEILFKTIWEETPHPYSIELLDDLELFLKENTSVKRLSESEFKTKVRSQINFSYLPSHLIKDEINRIRNYEFIEPTFSIIFDVSILFGELLIREVTNIYWDLEKREEYSGYGHPILKNDSLDYSICPSLIISAYCHNLVKKTTKESIREIFFRQKNNLTI